MSNGNAFWREVIDYLPHLVLVFRIDEQDQAHLIFCNNLITEKLGYAPKEYVLASETDEQVSSELKMLVDEVAQRSHDVDSIPARPCTLTTKQGEARDFQIDFRIFRTKSARTNLIAVELQEPGEGVDFTPDDYTQPAEQPEVSPTGGMETDWVVVEDNVMQTVWKQIEQLAGQPTLNVALRGEAGTGRRTLARKLVGLRGSSPRNMIELHPSVREQRFEELLRSTQRLELLLVELGNWPETTQRMLRDFLARRQNRSQEVRVTATLQESLEQSVEAGDFDTELYYMLSLHPILVPPLRHRPNDIRAATKQYVVQVSEALRMDPPEIPEEELDKLAAEKWEGNFPQLYLTLRNALLKHEEGPLQVRLPSASQSRLFEEANVDEDEVLNFDEMNRRYLSRVLELTDGKIYGDDGAAALLDLKPTTLQSKLKKLGLK